MPKLTKKKGLAIATILNAPQHGLKTYRMMLGHVIMKEDCKKDVISTKNLEIRSLGIVHITTTKTRV